MNKRKWIIVAAVILIAILTLVAVLISYYFKSRTASQPATAVSAPTRADDLTVSGQILGWLDSTTRDERGVYNQFYNCTTVPQQPAVCDNGNSSNRTGTPVMWANFLYWQATGDTDALARLERDLAAYSDGNIVGILQTNDLSCYYMTPIALGSQVSLSDRDLARQICLRTVYETPADSPRQYSATAQTDPLDVQQYGANSVIAQLLNVLAPSTPTASPSADITAAPIDRSWATFATDYAARYRMDNAPNTLALAYYYFAGALTNYQQDATAATDINQGCEMLLAASQFCRLNSDKSDFSCLLATSLGSQLRQLPLAESNPNFVALAKCAMADSTNSDYYLSFIRDYYHSDDNALFQFNDFRLLNDFNSITKSVVTNALFAGLLTGQ